MWKITIIDKQEPSAQSADRTKAMEVWSWRSMYLLKPGKWPSQHLHLKINSAFHARKNPEQQYLKEIMFSNASFSKKHIYVYNHAAYLSSSAWESFIRQKLDLFLSVSLTTYQIFPQFGSNWSKRLSGSSTLTLRFDTTWNINFC